MATKKNRNPLIHYPRTFLLQISFRTIAWLTFLPLFIVLGKRFSGADLLGKIYHFIFRKEKSFEQYFLGSNPQEKNKLLNIALYFILIIIILDFLSLLINRYLWSKDHYIENNDFYLHNKWIFIINSLIHLASAFLLTFSLASALTTILALLFISFNTWGLRKIFKKTPSPQLENSFAWKNSYIQKILLYSVIVILVVPLIIGYFQRFHDVAMKETIEGFAKAYQEMVNGSKVVKSFVELIIKANYSLFHWVILIWFIKELVKKRTSEFSSFWTKVNGIEKRKNDFKHYYYYQVSWAKKNQTSIKLGDYKYLENIPNFMSQEYLEGNLDINQFAQRNKQIVQHVEFCEQKIGDSSKRNFLNYCLFNEFKSWSDCLQTQDLLKKN